MSRFVWQPLGVLALILQTSPPAQTQVDSSGLAMMLDVDVTAEPMRILISRWRGALAILRSEGFNQK